MMDANFFDVIIIGGGPAGLTAALYLARAKYRVLVMEKEKFGGQITITSEVVNFPGIARGSGNDITAVMRNQAQSFGAEFVLAEAESVDLSGEEKIVNTPRGEYRSYGVVIATGARPRSVGFEGEAEFKGRGVAYCATCDGEFFTGLDVFVVGGGFAAAEEAVFLTKYARHVTILIRGNDFSCAKATADAAKNHEKITVHYNTRVQSVSGTDKLRHMKCLNTKSGEEWEYEPPVGETFGVFVFAGYEPATELLTGQVELTEGGYVKADENGKTGIDGVYAAGDIRQKVLRQMVTATSDGAVAATELERFVAAMHRKTGKIPSTPEMQTTRTEQPKPRQRKAEPAVDKGGFFSPQVRAQLEPVLQKLENPITLKVELDDRPVSRELERFLSELKAMTDKISLSMEYDPASIEAGTAPCIRVLRQNGEDCGIAFHGVPGGHEFNSFIVGLYNAAGPGQSLDERVLKRIKAIKEPLNMRILVTLSCSMCPDLVMAAQRMATLSPAVRAEVYDINHFPDLQKKYKVMSVPCLVLDDDSVSFGKMNLTQLLDYLERRQSAEKE